MNGSQEVTDMINCNILGKKKEWVPTMPMPTYDGGLNDTQWVEISGSEYRDDELDLVRWLKVYGEIVSTINQLRLVKSSKALKLNAKKNIFKLTNHQQIHRHLK